MTYDEYDGATLKEVSLEAPLHDPFRSVHIQRGEYLTT